MKPESEAGGSRVPLDRRLSCRRVGCRPTCAVGKPPLLVSMKTILLTLMLSLVAGPYAHSAESQWKAGLATVNITPEKPVPMAGYASRTKPFEKVEQAIYAKALALEDRDGHRAVLVTTDLLGLSRAVAEPVCERIQQKTKLDRSQILLSSSHAQSAP